MIFDSHLLDNKEQISIAMRWTDENDFLMRQIPPHENDRERDGITLKLIPANNRVKASTFTNNLDYEGAEPTKLFHPRKTENGWLLNDCNVKKKGPNDFPTCIIDFVKDEDNQFVLFEDFDENTSGIFPFLFKQGKGTTVQSKRKINGSYGMRGTEVVSKGKVKGKKIKSCHVLTSSKTELEKFSSQLYSLLHKQDVKSDLVCIAR